MEHTEGGPFEPEIGDSVSDSQSDSPGNFAFRHDY